MQANSTENMECQESTGHQALAVQAKKILLLGSGFVAQPCAEYVLRRPENSLTIASAHIEKANALAELMPRKVAAAQVDVGDPDSLDAIVSSHDLVISLIPFTFHVNVIKSAIKYKKHVVTTSYVSAAMKALQEEVKKAGIVVMNEIGFDPGLDHLYAVKTIDDVHKAGGKIVSFLSYCCGLPAPCAVDNPLGYAFSWSSRGVLLALLNDAKFYKDGKLVEVDGKRIMAVAHPYFIDSAFDFVAYPNRDSTVFRQKYNIPDAQTVIRGNLRYQGFPRFIETLIKLGFLDESPRDFVKSGAEITWADVTKQTIGASSSGENALIERVKALADFSDTREQDRIIEGLRWIGLFSYEAVTACGNLLDTLGARLEAKMQYKNGQKDMVLMQHKFEIENKDGSRTTRTATLLEYGAPFHTGQGPSAMARLVGVPCGIATQLILDGKINTSGVLAPYDRELVDILLEEVEKENIFVVEKDL